MTEFRKGRLFTRGAVLAVLDRMGLTGPAAQLHRRIASVRKSFGRSVWTLGSSRAGPIQAHGAAEWLLDNDYVIEAALEHVRESLPVRFVAQLRIGTDRWPIVYDLAREYWAEVADFDPNRLAAYVDRWQTESPLTIGELWALPAFLRLSVAEDLAAAAHEAAEAVRAAPLPDEAATATLAPSQDGRDPDVTQRASIRLEQRVAACVTTLRALDAADWQMFVERVGVVDAALRQDPGAVYSGMEFATRDAYRKEVEALARTSGRSEQEVAKAVVELAAAAPSGRMRHVGAYLVAEGRPTLESFIGIQDGRLSRFKAWTRAHAAPMYLGCIAAGTVMAMSVPLLYLWRLDTGAVVTAVGLAVTLIPALGLAVTVVNRAVTLLVHPRLLPKMDFADGIPPAWKALVAVPALLEEDEIENLLLGIEMCYLGNEDPELTFALLVDPPDAAQEQLSEDAGLLERTARGVRLLNERYARSAGARPPHSCGPFALIARDRRWNPVEQCWMGWERKRGKLEELNLLLLGLPGSTLRVVAGDATRLEGVVSVITLDADTNLPAGGAARLVGTLAHPLNRPVFDDDASIPRVVAGYTVIQPRVETAPASAGATQFARIYSGNIALDLYTHAVSDVYQDLFREGVYTGKGIYDVAGFARSLDGAVPENRILSHDLFEGLHGRAGLVSDIVVYEDYPAGVLDYMRRMHRWVRGDWQLMRWLLPVVPARDVKRPNTFGLMDRWKIADNLRRTLLPPAILALLVAGWTVLPGNPWVWTILGLGVVASPVLLAPITAAHRIATGARWLAAGRDALWTMRDLASRVILDAALLPYESVIITDAVVRTLYRLTVSHQRLMEWKTASSAGKRWAWIGRPAVWREMAAAVTFAVAILVLVAFTRLEALPAALGFIVVWAVAPEIAHRVSRREVVPTEGTDLGAHRELRRVARKTWLYFERHVGPEGNWLAPDHYQEDPLNTVARRTSPTNIGLGMLSTLAAFDRGYITVIDLVRRLESAHESMTRLERRRGHLFNWYNTSDLSPMEPRYVSTVDSGNLVGSLLTLSVGLGSVPSEPLPRSAQQAGLLDTLDVLRGALQHVTERGLTVDRRRLARRIGTLRRLLAAEPADAEAWTKVLARVEHTLLPEIERLAVSLVSSLDEERHSAPAEMRLWLGRFRYEVHSAQRDLVLLLPWTRYLAEVPTVPSIAEPALRRIRRAAGGRVRLLDVPSTCRAVSVLLDGLSELVDDDADNAVATWTAAFRDALRIADATADELITSLGNLEHSFRTFALEMDFPFLYDPARKLFRIGYNVSDDAPDANHYDLLASEARLASFIAIATGAVSESHWLHLGRPYGRVAGAAAVLSWGATAFEYLMPRLLMFHPRGSLLDVSCRAAVAAHQRFAERYKIPWGISESAYHAFDTSGEYQYRSFGVPGLGLKRNLGDRLVVAPYASFLALPYDPAGVLDNARRLRSLGAEGTYGFYDAMDFGDSEAGGQQGRAVRTYMSHHQAMLLLAIHNFLSDDLMVRRFHSAPQVLASERLLYEQRPRQAPSVTAWRAEQKPGVPSAGVGVTPAWGVPTQSATPQVHLLSNGHLTSLVSARGGGKLVWNGLAVTPPEFDPVTENVGLWIYLRDRDSGRVWSPASEPKPQRGPGAVVRFAPHDAGFQRVQDGISSHMSVTVVPAPDAEVRRVRLVNESARHRRLTVTSYAEVALDEPGAFARHPAFSRLFIQSAFVEEVSGILFHRRWRESGPHGDPYLLHALVADESASGVRFETDRGAFLGRGGSEHAPEGLRIDAPRSGPAATLDPAMALALDVDLGPGEEMVLAFVTVVAPSRGSAMRSLAHLDSVPRIDRAIELARRAAAIEQSRHGLSGRDARIAQRLLSATLAGGPGLRPGQNTLSAAHDGQRGLWPYGISGDAPILLVEVDDVAHGALVSQVLRAHASWRGKGVPIDLVILDESTGGYERPVNDRVAALIKETGGTPWLNQRGGVHLVDAERMPVAERRALASCARVVLHPRDGDLWSQLAAGARRPTRLPAFVPLPSHPTVDVAITPLRRPDDLQFDNGLGGFTPDGREYVIWLEPGTQPAAPWANVIANPNFGFLVTERGMGSTWSVNAAERRLTTWANDPLADPPSEAVFLRDEETGSIWSATPAPTPAEGPYEVRHGAGYSVFRHRSHGLDQQLRVFVAPDAPVKMACLRIENLWPRPRRVTATYYAEWVLGARQADASWYVVPGFDHGTQALLAQSRFGRDYADRVAFLTSSEAVHGLTTDRREFLGLGRTSGRQVGPGWNAVQPAGLGRIGLSGTLEPGSEPCAALQVHLDLEPGEVRELHFVLGDGASRAEALDLARRYRDPAAVSSTWDGVVRFWDDLLGRVQVDTPDAAMNLLLNRWLPYQALACRVWGRAAVYQSSGAFGFRDQLQDVCALLWLDPGLARAHILEAATHQFEEGDVLHWWHPPSNAGVRTRFSDDLLWLPYAVARYVKWTGDRAVLDELVPFLRGESLGAVAERYGQFEVGNAGSLLDHCLRAIQRGATTGSNGLPLFGSGDWNDGMSRVGIGGTGESVWLAWFLMAVLNDFAVVLDSSDAPLAAEFRERAEAYRVAVEASAWDGEWYLRGRFDDGSPLGSAANAEGRIDAIAQAWAVISGMGNPERAERAMAAVERELLRPDAGLLLLLAPPFESSSPDPGYIRAYPPGVRENGGQYTHAAVWAGIAYAMAGRADLAHEIFGMLGPVLRTSTAEGAALYRGEPYAVAADVYGVEPFVGRAGWTWYTGAAAWLYRFGLEHLLGISREGSELKVNPCIPESWKGFSARVMVDGVEHRIEVPRAGDGGPQASATDAPVHVAARGEVSDSAQGVVVTGDEPG